MEKLVLIVQYDDKIDIVGINVKPGSIDHLERLQYFIASTGIAVAQEK